MVAWLLQRRIMRGCFPGYERSPQGVVLGLSPVGGPFVEGDTITVDVVRTGSPVGTCSVVVELSGIAPGWLVDAARQVIALPAATRASLATGRSTRRISWRTRALSGVQGSFTGRIRLLDPVGATLDAAASSVSFQMADTTTGPGPDPDPVPVIAIERVSPATIGEGQSFIVKVTSTVKGMTVPATFDWAATSSRNANDLVVPRSGQGVAIGGAEDFVELVLPTASITGNQGTRTLTATISNIVGGTLGTASVTCTLQDAVLPADLLTPSEVRIVTDRASFLAALNGTSPYTTAAGAGTHIVLADDTVITGDPIKIQRSGANGNPLVIRSATPYTRARANVTRRHAKIKAPLGIKADDVWVYGIDFHDQKNAKPSTAAMGSMSLHGDKACGVAVQGLRVQVMRCNIDWSSMRGTAATRGANIKAMHGVHFSQFCQDCKFIRNDVWFTAERMLSDMPPGTPSTSTANEIRPVLACLNPRGAKDGSQNRGLEIAYNLFKRWPGGDWWDPLLDTPLGSSYYDKYTRGFSFNVGAEYNDNLNTPVENIDIHHNVIAEQGKDVEFAGVRARSSNDNAKRCKVRNNTTLSGEGLRVRNGQYWLIQQNYIKMGAKGLYANYGRGHIFVGNVNENTADDKSFIIYVGNVKNEAIDPYPAMNLAAWTAIGYPWVWSESNGYADPRPANIDCVWIANRGKLIVGVGSSNKRQEPAADNKIYGHMDKNGNAANAYGSVVVDKVYPAPEGRKHTGTVLSGTIPAAYAGYSTAPAVAMTENQVGPESWP